MDQGPLVSEQIEAGARFLGEFHKCYPVQAAFWLKKSEEGAWYLYVVSEQITDDNFDVGYGEVARIAVTIQDPWFNALQVKLIGQDDPLATAVADLQRRYAGRTPTRFHDRTLGSVTVDEIYLYPSPIPAPVP